MLTAPRSGSSWLSSLANSVGTMGTCSEWVDSQWSEISVKSANPSTYVDDILKVSQTDNGVFALKLFPRYLFLVHHHLGIDFIDECMKRHETTLVVLDRTDALRQAISFMRGRQTKKWNASIKAKRPERYDFEMIARAYVYIQECRSFWRTYLPMKGFAVRQFTYEDLLASPAPMLDFLADRIGVQRHDQKIESEFRVQRDAVTEDWAERFINECQSADILKLFGPQPASSRNLKNLARLFRPIKPSQILFRE